MATPSAADLPHQDDAPQGDASAEVGSSIQAWRPAPIPVFEEERLAELHSLDLLDTAPEERFDRLTQLAASMFDMPAVLISLIDRDRQFFKSNVGLEGVTETPRGVAFCAYTILERETLVVPDATLDERFAGNPLVTGAPEVRFYAGTVLRGPTGQPVGTLCMVDTAPRVFTPKQSACLRSLADMAEDELRRGLHLSKLKAHTHRALTVDEATGLPNRRHFAELLERSLAAVSAAPAAGVFQRALLRIDLSVTVEALRGRDLHEECVAQLAHRLAATLGNHEVLGRWSHEQLAVLISAPQTLSQLLSRAQEIADALMTPLTLGSTRIRPTPYVGISGFPHLAEDTDALARQAGLAMAHARQRAQGAFGLFSQAVDDEVSRQAKLEERLYVALEEGGLSVVFQPRVDAMTGRVVGAEALARWKDDELGWVSPAEFIPVAERLKLIGELDLWVLEEAVRSAKGWIDRGLPAFPISVNLGGDDLMRDTLCEEVAAILKAYDYDPHLLELEVTEHSVIADLERARVNMEATGALGVRFSLDDFGTGYSSLSYLTAIPVQVIKIDRSFIQKMVGSPQAARLVGSIISMARGLGAKVVAEGAETAAEVLRLRHFGCDEIQGYYFSRPIEPEAYARLLAADLPLGPDVAPSGVPGE